MRTAFLLVLLACSVTIAQDRPPEWILTPPLPDSKPILGDRRLPAIYTAGSRIRDDKTLGGFAPCLNYPIEIGKRTWGAEGTVSLIAFPNEPIAYFKNKGMPLRLVNRSSKTMAFEACDSCLYIVQEALDDTGKWREIEEPPSTQCGNSFHRVFLKTDELWEFRARCYDGPIKTKLRFRFDPSGEKDTAKPIYSNEFVGHIAKVQFRMTPNASDARRAFRSKDAKEDGVLDTLIKLLDENAGWGAVRRFGWPQRNAILHLAEFGPDAKKALPAMRKLMKGEKLSFRSDAAYAVWKIDGKAHEPVQTLISVLTDADEDSSHHLASVWLTQMGPVAKDAVPALCKTLANGNSQAAIALGAIKARPELAVPALIAALKHKDATLRHYASDALREFRNDAKPASPALREAMHDKDVFVRASAAETLWIIDGKADVVIPSLIADLRSHPSPYGRATSAEVLGKIGPLAKTAVDPLTTTLKDEWRTARVAAASALWKVTKQPEPALATLIDAIKDATSLSESDTVHAIEVLKDMSHQARPALPALRATLKRCEDAEGWARDSVEMVIRKIETEAK